MAISAPHIRPATAHDITWLDHLQRRHGETIGFLPHPAIHSYLNKHAIWVVEENGDPAGYAIAPPRLRWQPQLRPITQACVALDAQRRHLGLALIAHIVDQGQAANMLGIQANCAIGVDANDFWKALRFVPICHYRTNSRRGREMICWRLALSHRLPLWFASPPKYVGFPPQAPILDRDLSRTRRSLEIAKKYVPQGRQTPSRAIRTIHAPS